MADMNILLNGLLMAADDYARAYHKWHGEDVENGDHHRMVEARKRLADGIKAVMPADGVEPMTDEQIDAIWDDVEPQGDPTGRKFARVFARAVVAASGVPETRNDSTKGGA